MRKVAHIMGIPITLDIPECRDPLVFEAVFARLRDIDKRYSPYKEDSELSRFRRGELSERELSGEMRQIMWACHQAEQSTGGYFSSYFNGQFDPTGYVKGWAVGEVSNWLSGQGFDTFCIGAGGDINAKSGSGKLWQIGLQDPNNKNGLIGKISAGNIAVATSGNYERGGHIINPKTGQPATDLKSIAVAGPDIVKADVLATAAFAMGERGVAYIETHTNYEALAVDKNTNIYMSAGMKDLLGA